MYERCAALSHSSSSLRGGTSVSRRGNEWQVVMPRPSPAGGGKHPRPLPVFDEILATTFVVKPLACAVFLLTTCAAATQTVVGSFGTRSNHKARRRRTAGSRLSVSIGRTALPDLDKLNEEATVGDVVAAEQTFHSLARRLKQMPTAKQRLCINTVIKACANAGDYARAEFWYQELGARRLEANDKTFGKLIEACAKAGRVDLAEKWRYEMELAGHHVNYIKYGTLVDACAKAADTDGAMKLLSSMAQSGVTIDETTITSVITSFSQKGDAHGAERILNDTLQHHASLSSVPSFCAVMTAWGRRRKFTEAERIFQRMTTMRIEPNIVCYNALIDACSRSDHPQRAEFWYEQAIRADLQPDLITRRSLLTAHAQASGVERAFEVFQNIVMQRLDPGLIGYTAIAKAFAKVGDMHKVEELIGIMTSRRIQPDSVLCGTLMYGYGKLRDLQTCEYWFEESPVKDVPQYTSMLAAINAANISKAEATSKAVALLRRMVDQSLQPNALTLDCLQRTVGPKRTAQEASNLGVDLSLPKKWRNDFDKGRDQRTVYRTQHKHTERALLSAETR